MKRAENFQGLEINFRKLLLVFFMRPSDLRASGIMRPLGACGPGAICPPPAARWSCTFVSGTNDDKITRNVNNR